jgi:mRNA interferase MazF
MKRGEIWWVNFDPAQGGEIRKRRPAVIVSNDKANAAQNRVQVLPVTSAIATIYPWEAPVRMSGRTSKALADQIRTVAKARLSKKIGVVTTAEMLGIEDAIRLQLGL